MSKAELIERSRKAIEAFNQLPAEEQARRLIAKGTINEKGEVLLGRDQPDADRIEKPDPSEPMNGVRTGS